MKKFTAKQFHENPSEVYRQAARGPVTITHRHHGEMVLSSSDQPNSYINVAIGDMSICHSGSEALAQIAKSNPEEYMKHVTEEMMRNWT